MSKFDTKSRILEFVFEEEQVDIVIPCLLVSLKEIMRMYCFFQGKESLDHSINYIIDNIGQSTYSEELKENIPRFLIASKLMVENEFE